MSRTLLFAALLGVSTSAIAQVTHIDSVEHIFGASNVNAMLGHGGLTAGISRDGDVTVLSWPSPSCCDQLTYLASNAFNVRSLPHLGAKEGMGITTGLAIDSGGTSNLYWLHDGTWQIAQQYLDDQSLIPVTTFSNAQLDLQLTVHDSIDPVLDVLQRRVQLMPGANAPVGHYALIVLANLSPTLSEVPELPIADWAIDIQNDFAAVWDSSSQSVIHFHPGSQGVKHAFVDLLIPAQLDYGSFDTALRTAGDDPATAAQLVAGLGAEFDAGVYAAITTIPAPTEHEVGYDATDFCGAVNTLADNIAALPDAGFALPVSPTVGDLFRCTDPQPGLIAANGWLHAAPDARLDATDGGGHLSGSDYAAGQVNVGLRAEFAPDAGTVALRIAFSSSATGATGLLAQLPAPDAFEANDQQAWHAYAAKLLVPTGVSFSGVPGGTAAAVTLTSTRALLHDAAGTARSTGAIVASIARQAPYGLDWPRDGSFFDLAFDIAGDTDRATRRLQWATTTMRTSTLTASQLNPVIDAAPPLDPTTLLNDYPANAWEMNSYADGPPGGNIRFEIDNTALMVWSMAVHPGYLDGDARTQVALSLYLAMSAGADTIEAWRDPANGLQAPANEDDNASFTQTLHGAVAVYAALRSAARLARFLGKSSDSSRWDARANELSQSIVTHFYNPDAGVFESSLPSDGVINIGSIDNGDTAWLVWPAELLPFNDPRVTRQLQNDLQAALAVLRGNGEGGQYLAKNFLAGAVAVTHGGDPSLLPLVQEGITRLAVLAPTADTQVYGEVYVNLGSPGAPIFDQRTSNPHLWEGTLTYLAAMALAHPERFDLEQKTLQPPSGCGCGTMGLDSGLAMPVLLCLLWRRKRSRLGDTP